MKGKFNSAVVTLCREQQYQYFLVWDLCYQFGILRNLRIDIKDRLEEYSQSIGIDIHVNTRSQNNGRSGYLTVCWVDYTETARELMATTPSINCVFWLKPSNESKLNCIVVYFVTINC